MTDSKRLGTRERMFPSTLCTERQDLRGARRAITDRRNDVTSRAQPSSSMAVPSRSAAGSAADVGARTPRARPGPLAPVAKDGPAQGGVVLDVLTIVVATRDHDRRRLRSRVEHGADRRPPSHLALTLPVWPVLFARQQMYASRFLTRLMDELPSGGARGVRRHGRAGAHRVGRRDGSRSHMGPLLPACRPGLRDLERFLIRRWFVHRRRTRRSPRDVVIIRTNAEALDLAEALQNPARVPARRLRRHGPG